MVIEIKTPKEIKKLRRAGKLAAETLVLIARRLGAGMETQEIDVFVHEHTMRNGGRCAPLNYKGFPKSVCTSINEVICHGIPGAQALTDGDILNIDVTTVLPAKKGFHGDTSATFYIGEPSAEARLVVETARRCLELGIEQVRPGGHIGDIGAVIQEYAESRNCSVVQEFVGHGIGQRFHCEPSVPHFGKRHTLERMEPGMVFTIEPMINTGEFDCEILKDGWTAITVDGGLSAQFEHTVAVTEEGCEVLTRREAPLENSEEFDWADLGPRSCFLPEA